jgi:hypothetical protein
MHIVGCQLKTMAIRSTQKGKGLGSQLRRLVDKPPPINLQEANSLIGQGACVTAADEEVNRALTRVFFFFF